MAAAISVADLVSRIQTGHPLCVRLAAVTQSDSTADPAGTFCGFVCNGAGIVKYTGIDGGDPITFTALAGVLYPIPLKNVWSTTTTATGIFGLVPV